MALAATAALVPTIAMAHPLGNFTINRYSGIEVAGNRLRVHYVLDMAEIPALQEKQKIGPGNTYVDDRAYLAARVNDIEHNLDLRVDGKPVGLTVADKALAFLPGQAGLTTLRIEALLTASAGGLGRHSVDYHDHNYQGHLGWKEITVRASDQAQVHDTIVAGRSISKELRAYPQDRLTSPLDVTSTTFSYVPGLSSSSIPRFLNPATGGFRIIQDQYASLIAQKLTPLVILLSIVLAVGLGAAHALSPGHGKAVMAGYLVGTRRSPKHAVILGATITVTHTVGVFALGLVTLFASALISPERLYPWLTLISGALVILLGVTLMISRTRLALVRGEPGDHPHDDHPGQDHDHPHGRDHGHEHGADPLAPHSHGLGTHSHAVPAGAGTGSLLMMGITGGLIPCPSALIVLLSAIALHRVLLGIVLIVAFSLGLALVLTGIGVALARGLPLLSRIPGSRRLGSGLRVVRFASVGGALVLTIAGMGLTLQAIPQVL